MKWFIALTVIAVLGGMTYVVAGVQQAIDDTGKEHSVACSKAMAGIGWKLPGNASDQRCTEVGGIFGATWSGSFRIPRADARPWLASLPGDRSRPVNKAGPDGIAEWEDGLYLSIDSPPGHPQVDVVSVHARWEGKDSAVVTFETFDY
ncbi:hypothetical protein [Streptomyces sp. UNOB3_S3]|uniref:hypothetical protein n=1 Tax=Streptomyces sp. UNOB3_S3 TaxID=2871682 RepID=UPI001E58CF93|nr:hypothetical protein [Streptomyces sp. UNOB3_S3]MCC3779631.1 hypothetical protein [Streptomyces sp. UNOB3_S3]